MNVSIFSKIAYENKHNWTLGQNKPNSNPIKPNLRKAKMNVNLTLTKDYRKKDDFVVRINKPNIRNAKNERKLNFNKGLRKKLCFSVQKNKPKQTQFKPNFERPKSLAKKSGHTPRFNCALYKKSIFWHYGIKCLKKGNLNDKIIHNNHSQRVS